MTIVGDDREVLWCQRYRPRKVEDCILPASIKETFSAIVKSGEIPNMLLVGGAGTGKTTVAMAMCDELDVDCLIINASMNGKIEELRTTILQFASTTSFSGGRKIVILDEADYLTAATQAALRNFMEEYSKNCGFILTCNFPNKVIDPIHSRCTVVDFKIPKQERGELAASFWRRAKEILKQEEIEFDPKVVAELVQRHLPDWRKVINELQKYSVSGKIDTGILAVLEDDVFKALIVALKEKDFKTMRKWVADNIDHMEQSDSSYVFRKVYDDAYKYVSPSSIPALVLLVGEWQFKATHSVDQEINLAAFLTCVMADVEFV